MTMATPNNGQTSGFSLNDLVPIPVQGSNVGPTGTGSTFSLPRQALAPPCPYPSLPTYHCTSGPYGLVNYFLPSTFSTVVSGSSNQSVLNSVPPATLPSTSSTGSADYCILAAN